MSTLEDLRKITVFAGLPEEQLTWLAQRGNDVHAEPGQAIFQLGDPADRMFALFEGEVDLRRNGVYIATGVAGEVSGMLPFSRMTHFTVSGQAVGRARYAWFSSSIFPEMLQRMPELAGRLVALMTDRVRETVRWNEQRQKLAALGKLSAGLAHELNNPAAAARRAASGLGEILRSTRETNLRLNRLPLNGKQREAIAQFELDCGQRAGAPVSLSSLEQSDLEEQLTTWLEAHQVADAWKLPPMLVEAGISSGELDALNRQIGEEALGEVLRRVTSLLTVVSLVHEIEVSTTRISDLVKAIKEYSYMDQAPEQEVDIHGGLESTLTILSHKIKKASVTVVRDYDRSLPKICARGSEINQVWTNLIDNAVDAMSENGAGAARELRVRTAHDPMGLLVEIADTGPGIPQEIQGQIFDPFFTTKPVGEGTGIGLDTVHRVVEQHHGDIRVDSKPGDTRFQVRLPLSTPH